MMFFVAQLGAAYLGGRVAAGCNGRPRQVHRPTVPLLDSVWSVRGGCKHLENQQTASQFSFSD
jgi:hypothetical protein